MSCRTESTTIDDVEVSVTQWPAEQAMLNKFRLLKTLGPALAGLAAGGDDEARAIGGGLSALFDAAAPEEVVALIKDCVVGVAYDGKRVTSTSFTELFSGDDLAKIYRIFVFVVKVNYGPLFQGEAVKELLGKMEGLANP